MKSILKLISFIGLVLTLFPAFLVFTSYTSLENCKLLMLIGTVVWFLTAPQWMNRNN